MKALQHENHVIIKPSQTSDKTVPKTKGHQNEKRSQADKRIDFLLKKQFAGDPSFRPLILKLAKYDPTPKKKYLAWLVKHRTDRWRPDDGGLEQAARCLEIHHKGAKYFSPLTWTGLRLEDVGYHADIFRYKPETLQRLQGNIESIIQTDEEDKQIRRGNLVVTAGAEVAYQDDRWTLVRIRTNEALRRLGQGTSWCVRRGNVGGYRFPFDFLLNCDGERFLANGRQVVDCRNARVSAAIGRQIHRIRSLAGDRIDRLRVTIDDLAEQQRRGDVAFERELWEFPDFAIDYSIRIIQGPWDEFEKQVGVAGLTASQAVRYAIDARRCRWPRFENKIKRAKSPLCDYRKAFPNSIPFTVEEVYQKKLGAWRERTPGAHLNPQQSSVQGKAESRQRDVNFEHCLIWNYSEASIKRYARFVASLAASNMKEDYREKFASYFASPTTKLFTEVNTELAPLIRPRKQTRLRLPENFRVAWS